MTLLAELDHNENKQIVDRFYFAKNLVSYFEYMNATHARSSSLPINHTVLYHIIVSEGLCKPRKLYVFHLENELTVPRYSSLLKGPNVKHLAT